MKNAIDPRSMLSGLFLVILLASCAIVASSQTPARGRPRPLATPPRVLTGAEIISQAGDVSAAVPVAEPESTPIIAPPSEPGSVSDLTDRIKRLESNRSSNYDEKQRRLMLNLDILTRAEQRTESLRKQLFEMIEKENTVKARLDQIEYDIRPEVIERTLQMAGSMRPEQIRESRRRSLEAERANMQILLTEIQSTRENLNSNLIKASVMVDRLRIKLEKDIDDSFLAE